MNYDDCLDRLNAELTKLNTFKSDLADAKAIAMTTGRYMEPRAYAELERNVRQQGALCQRLQTEISRLRRQRTAHAERSDTPQRFVDVARRRLTPELFNELMAEAKGLELVDA